MRVRFLSVVAVLAMAVNLSAQSSSPRDTVSTDVGGKKVSVDYGRPSLKGRKLDDLIAQLPPDRIWRAGDNQVTTLTTETDLLVGGKKVAAGKYSVYVHAPATGDWSLVINKDLGIPLSKLWAEAPAELANQPWPRLDGYDKIATQELVRAPMKAGKPASAVETFTISFAPAGNGATMTLAWGDRSWSLDLKPGK
jgi:Protein of unknown function (DUF2911)